MAAVTPMMLFSKDAFPVRKLYAIKPPPAPPKSSANPFWLFTAK